MACMWRSGNTFVELAGSLFLLLCGLQELNSGHQTYVACAFTHYTTLPATNWNILYHFEAFTYVFLFFSLNTNLKYLQGFHIKVTDKTWIICGLHEQTQRQQQMAVRKWQRTHLPLSSSNDCLFALIFPSWPVCNWIWFSGTQGRNHDASLIVIFLQ